VRSELGVGERAPLILHAGRFIEQKNHEGVLEVFERVVLAEPSARLVLLGVGPLLDRVLASIERRKLNRSVTYNGLRDDVVTRVLPASDVFLFPSLNEGFGLAALEANAASVPVVATNIAGLDEAVLSGRTAMLHAISDIEGMAGSVIGFLRDAALASKFGAAGREHAMSYSHEASARKLRELYNDCLDVRLQGST
jgi:glycosyltransferase involved in cell wall biosynthesis